MNDTLTDPEAPVDGHKFDWRLPVFLVVLNLVAIGVQWGTISAKLDELFRDKDQQERHLEFIDNELRTRGVEAGEVKEFRRDAEKRFDSLDKKLDALGRRQ